jgi:RimJ/RimL family protein N-acetyltransferase
MSRRSACSSVVGDRTTWTIWPRSSARKRSGGTRSSGGWGRDETEEFLERRIAEWATRGWSLWAVEVKGERKLIGYLGLAPPEFLPEVMPTVEIGWRLDPAWWGRGFATEGGRAALAYGFEVLDLDEIVGIYEPENRASGRVMNRLGMTPWRDATHPTLDVPLRVYRIMRNEWCAV